MNVSARTEYACVAVLELAISFDSSELLRLREIAEPHGIPTQFLVQILQQLKAAGLITSTRGAAGGYRLVKDPRELTIGEVKSIIEGPPKDPAAESSSASQLTRSIHRVWRRLASAERQILDSVTFAELAADLGRPAQPMYYI